MNTLITVSELQEILRLHVLWLRSESGGKHADLYGADLRGANLRGADLRGANLRRADLRRADLRGANLRGADLRRADLYGANLSGADLYGANLRGADLRRADLRRADLSGADLRRADLRGANLSGANLSGADLYGADLSGANLSGANLRGANLILIGQDIRGYLFYASKNDDGVVVIRAGCREFIGISAAREHWSNRHKHDEVLRADCLSLVDRCETMARVRGWKLEAESVVVTETTTE
jgi:hypothetical protein